jgi:hypothetical protein
MNVEEGEDAHQTIENIPPYDPHANHVEDIYQIKQSTHFLFFFALNNAHSPIFCFIFRAVGLMDTDDLF